MKTVKQSNNSVVRFECAEYKGPPAFDVLTCAKKHKPRHYMPRNAMAADYGWKRVCADFETHNAKLTGAAHEAAPVD